MKLLILILIIVACVANPSLWRWGLSYGYLRSAQKVKQEHTNNTASLRPQSTNATAHTTAFRLLVIALKERGFNAPNKMYSRIARILARKGNLSEIASQVKAHYDRLVNKPLPPLPEHTFCAWCDKDLGVLLEWEIKATKGLCADCFEGNVIHVCVECGKEIGRMRIRGLKRVRDICDRCFMGEAMLVAQALRESA